MILGRFERNEPSFFLCRKGLTTITSQARLRCRLCWEKAVWMRSPSDEHCPQHRLTTPWQPWGPGLRHRRARLQSTVRLVPWLPGKHSSALSASLPSSVHSPQAGAHCTSTTLSLCKVQTEAQKVGIPACVKVNVANTYRHTALSSSRRYRTSLLHL